MVQIPVALMSTQANAQRTQCIGEFTLLAKYYKIGLVLAKITYFKSAVVLFFKQRAVVPQSRLLNEKLCILAAQGHVKLRDFKVEGTKKHCTQSQHRKSEEDGAHVADGLP